jgi:hypothetical protein
MKNAQLLIVKAGGTYSTQNASEDWEGREHQNCSHVKAGTRNNRLVSREVVRLCEFRTEPNCVFIIRQISRRISQIKFLLLNNRTECHVVAKRNRWAMPVDVNAVRLLYVKASKHGTSCEFLSVLSEHKRNAHFESVGRILPSWKSQRLATGFDDRGSFPCRSTHFYFRRKVRTFIGVQSTC